MWLERRGFRFGSDVTTTTTSTDLNSNKNDTHDDDDHHHHRFVTCMDYVAVPFASEEEWRSSSFWYSRCPRVNDDGEEEEDDWRLVTPQCAEYFLLGWSDGVVERRMIVPRGMKWYYKNSTTTIDGATTPSAAASTSSASSCGGAPCSEVEVLYRQRGQVMALKTLGTLVGSVSCGVLEYDYGDTPTDAKRNNNNKSSSSAEVSAAVATVASSHPLYKTPAAPVHLPHSSSSSSTTSASLVACTPRSMLLWEGRKCWSRRSSSCNNEIEEDDEEASMVYVFTGDEQGRVRLWRVNVVVSAPTVAAVQLLAVFGCVLHGGVGDAPLRGTDTGSSVARDHLSATASFQSSTKLLCLTLDGNDDDDEGDDDDDTTSHGGLRLLAGTQDRKIFVWDLSQLSNKLQPLHEWGSAGTSGASSSNTTTFTSSKLFQKFVWVVEPTSSVVASSSTTATTTTTGAGEAKRKKRIAALAASYGGFIGQVVNIANTAGPAAATASLNIAAAAGPAAATSSLLLLQLLLLLRSCCWACCCYIFFCNVHGLVRSGSGGSLLTKPMDFHLSELQVMQVSSLAFLADDRGAVFSMTSLHGGVVVSGGADGNLKVWCWGVQTEKYNTIPILRSRKNHHHHHSDLITSLGALCPPALSFFSTSLDGYVKTWRLSSTTTCEVPTTTNGGGGGLSSVMFGLEEELSLLVRPTNGWSSSSSSAPSSSTTTSSSAHQPMLIIPAGECAPIATACSHREFQALFVALHMTTTVRTYTFEAVDTCSLPPGRYAFDGTRTVALIEEGHVPNNTDSGGGGCVGDQGAAAAPDDLKEVFAALEDNDGDRSSSDDYDEDLSNSA
ncbi:Hypothetical protein, putative [Bodo saltans]|uniref:Uncharacterized protein n=1 Tax=Bodo saltans TaxID=75058 RepID=A0A0S4JF43_BODSA|nr:Hypothetical protein, putative [Bodo saltans]|eukprot:CUG87605.1 Hypothetical protein, putative [Bodo saltans]